VDDTNAQVGASSIAINTFASPREAFTALKQQPKFLLPFLVLLLASALVTFLYMNGVDIAWLIENAMLRNPNADPAMATQAADAVAGLPQSALAAAAAVGAMIALSIWMLIQALYFKIFSLLAKDGVSYKLWFGIVAFCSLPAVLRHLAGTASLLVNDISMMPGELLNPLSAARLLGLEPSGRFFDQYVLNLDPMSLWTLALLVIAHRVIAGRSLAAALAIVVAPIALMLGLWLVT